MQYSTLRSELDRLASNIWADVTLVRSSHGPARLGEVTVTERLHLDLIHSGALAGLVTYDVPNEIVTGADWEWFVQVPGTPKFVHYRIQAKILKSIAANKAPALRFDHINHRRGGQRATLLADAARCGAIPYYAFYIGDPWPQHAGVVLPPQASGTPSEHFGATAVPAKIVDTIYNRARIKSDANQYLKSAQSRRLSDLFRFPPSGASPSGKPSPDPLTDETVPYFEFNNTPSLEEVARELPPEKNALLNEIHERTTIGRSPIISRDPLDGEGNIRLTAFFTRW